MAIIKKMKIYDGSAWVQHDFGVEAANVTVETIEGLNQSTTNLQETLSALNNAINTASSAIANVGGTFPIHLDDLSVVTGILGEANGGTGKSSVTSIYTNLSSTTPANALAGNIGVTGRLGVANGGTGRNSAPSLSVNLASSVANDIFTNSTIGVRNTLPIANGGTARTSMAKIYAKLDSTSSAYALDGNIGVIGILKVANGGTGSSVAPSIWTNLASSAKGNPLSGNIGVTGTLPVANGGTGKTTAPSLSVNLASSVANNIFTNSTVGVRGKLPVANGGTGTAYGYTWQNLIGGTSGSTTTKAWTRLKTGLSLSSYSEIMIIAKKGTQYLCSAIFPISTLFIPAGTLPDTSDNPGTIKVGSEIYLGGGASKITSGDGGTRRAVCRMTTTTFGAYQGHLDGSPVHLTWWVYAR